MKKMENVSTQKSPNGTFVDVGSCVECATRIVKRIKDHLLIVEKKTKSLFPKHIKKGEGTSKKLISRIDRQKKLKGQKNGKTIL